MNCVRICAWLSVAVIFHLTTSDDWLQVVGFLARTVFQLYRPWVWWVWGRRVDRVSLVLRVNQSGYELEVLAQERVRPAAAVRVSSAQLSQEGPIHSEVK
jgi:hypothetical protein